MNRKRYIFRWKDVDGRPIEVTPSEGDSPEAVWAWATKYLRGATETPEQGRRNVRVNGEVIEVHP